MLDVLKKYGLIDEESIEEYYPRVRDREDVKVLRCKKSGVIFLSSKAHINPTYYQEKPAGIATVSLGNESLSVYSPPDLEWRIREFRTHVAGKRWLDFGTGQGDILDALGSHAISALGVEANAERRQAGRALGRRIAGSLSELDGEVFDVITLFHVLEHLPDPGLVLRRLRARLTDGGVLIVETPHANDVLLCTLDCEAFKAFTFWSEHLVLHTRQSLSTMLAIEGFEAKVEGRQRYSVANHMYWLRNARPGGHEVWEFLENDQMRDAYEKSLQSINQTDTLVAVARKRAGSLSTGENE